MIATAFFFPENPQQVFGYVMDLWLLMVMFMVIRGHPYGLFQNKKDIAILMIAGLVVLQVMAVICDLHAYKGWL